MFTNDVANSNQKKLHFTVNGYDAQGKVVRATLYCTNGYNTMTPVAEVVDPANGSNVASFDVPIGDIVNAYYYDNPEGTCVINRIGFTDKSGNITYYDCSNDNLNFTINRQSVNALELSVVDETPTLTDSEYGINTKVRLSLDKQVDTNFTNGCTNISYWCDNTTSNADSWAGSGSMSYNSEMSNSNSYVYEGDVYFGKHNVSGEYKGSTSCDVSLNGWIQRITVPESAITLTNNVFEEYEQPTQSTNVDSNITSISSNKDGGVVKEGEVITYTVKTNTNPDWCCKDEYAGNLELVADVEDQIEQGRKTIDLHYVGTTNGENIYQGSVNANDLYPCEWSVSSAYINSTWDYDNNICYDVNSYPSWSYNSEDVYRTNSYFYVNLNGTTKTKTYEQVNVNIYNPVSGQTQTFVANNVGNHVTFSQLVGGNFVTPSSDKNYGKCIGIESRNSNEMIDTNDICISKIGYQEGTVNPTTGQYELSDIYTVDLEVAYENQLATVIMNNYTKYDESLGLYTNESSDSFVSHTYYVPRNYTENDLNNVLPKGKDASSNIKFQKWSFSDLGTGGFVTAEPVYTQSYQKVNLSNVMVDNYNYDGSINASCPYRLTSVTGVLFGDNITVDSVKQNLKTQFPAEAGFQGWEVVETYSNDDTINLRAKYAKQYFPMQATYFDKSTYNGKTNYVKKSITTGTFVDEVTVDSIKASLNGKISHPEELEFSGWTVSIVSGMGAMVNATYAKSPLNCSACYLDNNNNVVQKNISGVFASDVLFKDIVNENTSDRREDTRFAISGGTIIPDEYMNMNISELSGWYGMPIYGSYNDVVISQVTYPELKTVNAVNRQGESYKYVVSKSVILAVPKSVTTEAQIVKFMQDKGYVGSLADYQALRSDITGIKGEVRSMNSILNHDTIYLTYKNGSPSVIDKKPQPKPVVNPEPVVNPTPEPVQEVIPEPVVVEQPVEAPVVYEEPETFVTASVPTQNVVRNNVQTTPTVTQPVEVKPVNEVPEAKTTEVQGIKAVVLDEVKVTEKIAEIQTAVQNAIAQAIAGGDAVTPTVKVSMINEDGSVATVVPKGILEAAKGQDVDVVLDMGGYSWTINGKDIKELKDVNLEVKMDANAVPSKVIEKLAGGKPTRQLSLTFDGDFGFKADLNLNLGSENAGQYGNLYYYDSNGSLVFMNAGKIDASGNASLEFSHASDYVIVIGEDMTEAENSSNVWWIVLIVVAAVAVAGGLGFAVYRKNRR